MRQANRFSGAGAPYAGLTTLRRGRVDWTGVVRTAPDQLDAPLRWRRGSRVFVNSMSDLFHESLSNEDIAAVFAVMCACPKHTFQVLTKRPRRMRDWFRWLEEDPIEHLYQARKVDWHWPDEEPAWPLSNVHVGVSVENQEQLERRVHYLATIDAAVKFVSAEPLLERVDFAGQLHSVDWMIVGGESGAGARPFDITWAREIAQECKAANVPCFIKQLGRYPLAREAGTNGKRRAHRGEADKPRGEWPRGTQFGNPTGDESLNGRVALLDDPKGGRIAEWPRDLRVRQYP